MRKSMFIVLALMAGVLLWGFASQTVATAAGAKDVPSGFGKKVAGCYLFEAWFNEGEVYTQSIGSISAEGAWSHTAENMFGGGDPEAEMLGPAHGVWIKTGPLEIKVVAVGHSFDKDGKHIYTWKAWVPLEFDEDFQVATCDGWPAAAYLPEQDWTNPNEEPAFTWNGYEMRLTRLNIE